MPRRASRRAKKAQQKATYEVVSAHIDGNVPLHLVRVHGDHLIVRFKDSDGLDHVTRGAVLEWRKKSAGDQHVTINGNTTTATTTTTTTVTVVDTAPNEAMSSGTATSPTGTVTTHAGLSAQAALRFGEGTVRFAGSLLPAAARDRYVEEWRDALYDLREHGEPWRRRVVEVAVIILNVPIMAVRLRLGRKRAVE